MENKKSFIRPWGPSWSFEKGWLWLFSLLKKSWVCFFFENFKAHWMQLLEMISRLLLSAAFAPALVRNGALWWWWWELEGVVFHSANTCSVIRGGLFLRRTIQNRWQDVDFGAISAFLELHRVRTTETEVRQEHNYVRGMVALNFML